jgi:hypothetical protein
MFPKSFVVGRGRKKYCLENKLAYVKQQIICKSTNQSMVLHQSTFSLLGFNYAGSGKEDK